MGLDETIRLGVATARAITLDLHGTVVWKRWTGQDGFGAPTPPAAPVNVRALIERKNKMMVLSDGRQILVKTKITILEPLTAQGSPGRREPVDERDTFVLPDGITGPIVDIVGFVDGGTGNPYLHEIYLGEGQ
jgi:hypothetical protein